MTDNSDPWHQVYSVVECLLTPYQYLDQHLIDISIDTWESTNFSKTHHLVLMDMYELVNTANYQPAVDWVLMEISIITVLGVDQVVDRYNPAHASPRLLFPDLQKR